MDEETDPVLLARLPGHQIAMQDIEKFRFPAKSYTMSLLDINLGEFRVFTG